MCPEQQVPHWAVTQNSMSRSARPRSLGGPNLGSAWDARILVVDDEPSLAEVLSRTMQVAGFQCRAAGSCREAHEVAQGLDPELALIDVMLPDGSGFELCHELRLRHPNLAVIFITARDSMTDKLTGLNLGGDDYITKPFSIAEVVARVNAVLRRIGRSVGTGRLTFADLNLDEDQHLVSRAGSEINLSPTEFKLLRLLMENAGRVLSKQQILALVWDYDFPGDPGMVEKFISQLRRKLDVHGTSLIHTVRGFGYVMRETA